MKTPIKDETKKSVADEIAGSERWQGIAQDANRRRVRVQLGVGTEEYPLEPTGIDRSGFAHKLGPQKSLDEALDALAAWLETQPLTGPDALRDELRAFARRLALLTPRDVQKLRGGGDLPIYRDFRDRLLPLAYDNLVDSVKLETLEAFAHETATRAVEIMLELGVPGEETPAPVGNAHRIAADLAATARGLAGIKEAELGDVPRGTSEEPASPASAE